MTDLKLTKDSDGIYDLSLVNGDLETVDSFDTSLLVSLFTDGRAEKSEVPTPELRRGWWGDTISDTKIGSRLWLLNQARLNSNTLNKALDYARLALNWLVTQNYSRSLNITGSQTDNGIQLNISIVNANGATESRYYRLWQQTGPLS